MATSVGLQISNNPHFFYRYLLNIYSETSALIYEKKPRVAIYQLEAFHIHAQAAQYFPYSIDLILPYCLHMFLSAVGRKSVSLIYFWIPHYFPARAKKNRVKFSPRLVPEKWLVIKAQLLKAVCRSQTGKIFIHESLPFGFFGTSGLSMAWSQQGD